MVIPSGILVIPSSNTSGNFLTRLCFHSFVLQIRPSRRGGGGGKKNDISGKEKGFLELKIDNNEVKEGERQSLEDFVLGSFEIGELPQSDYNTLRLIKPEKVNDQQLCVFTLFAV